MRDLSLHLMDILQNSLSAGAEKITISITVSSAEDDLLLEVSDDGEGMDEALLKEVTDPFVTTRTTRKVGMGISMLKASAQRASGDLIISSQKAKGTTLRANFKISHIDRLPLGDISETIESVIMCNPEKCIELVLLNGKDKFRFCTEDVKKELNGVPITEFAVLTWIKEFIEENTKHILGGVLNEIDC